MKIGYLKNYMDMKKLMILVVMVAALALPAMAQSSQDWQSTSTMRGAGSAYSSQVTAVGATSVEEMSSTTAMASEPGGPRRIGPTHGEDNPNPVGEPVLPLLLMAAAAAGVIYLRKRNAHNKAQA